ncbi:MAG: nuclear transport factor 2 family protein [Sandaracinaceae bacterium]|nr:nuclear transport factor 2 family protein [Sandaracinaceae bacterium]MBK7774150.1 nuclear transport factor 2 family protein [Sandaracinaceae bacterium]MBK8409844.1 nuclear transport factor 2 family protein [Sandaracinaceae bacterium]
MSDPGAPTPGSVAESFASALVRDDWTAVAAKLAPDATWTIAGEAPVHGRDDITDRLREYVRKGSAPRLDGPLRVTRGTEVAWPSRERARFSNETGDAARIDIVDVDAAGLVRGWATVLTGSPTEGTQARSAALLAYVERVGRADAEAALELFAGDCSVEDPVGTPVHQSRAAVEAFYRGGLGAITGTTLLGPPVVASEGPGAIAFRVELQLPDRAIALEVIDVMSFDAAGRFTSMRAFWGRDNRLSR